MLYMQPNNHHFAILALPITTYHTFAVDICDDDDEDELSAHNYGFLFDETLCDRDTTKVAHHKPAHTHISYTTHICIKHPRVSDSISAPKPYP